MKKRYMIVHANGPRQLEERVNIFLADGWSLCGGIAHSGMSWCQAMVRENRK
jgi:hypothetical protein